MGSTARKETSQIGVPSTTTVEGDGDDADESLKTAYELRGLPKAFEPDIPNRREIEKAVLTLDQAKLGILRQLISTLQLGSFISTSPAFLLEKITQLADEKRIDQGFMVDFRRTDFSPTTLFAYHVYQLAVEAAQDEKLEASLNLAEGAQIMFNRSREGQPSTTIEGVDMAQQQATEGTFGHSRDLPAVGDMLPAGDQTAELAAQTGISEKADRPLTRIIERIKATRPRRFPEEARQEFSVIAQQLEVQLQLQEGWSWTHNKPELYQQIKSELKEIADGSATLKLREIKRALLSDARALLNEKTRNIEELRVERRRDVLRLGVLGVLAAVPGVRYVAADLGDGRLDFSENISSIISRDLRNAAEFVSKGRQSLIQAYLSVRAAWLSRGVLAADIPTPQQLQTEVVAITAEATPTETPRPTTPVPPTATPTPEITTAPKMTQEELENLAMVSLEDYELSVDDIGLLRVSSENGDLSFLVELVDESYYDKKKMPFDAYVRSVQNMAAEGVIDDATAAEMLKKVAGGLEINPETGMAIYNEVTGEQGRVLRSAQFGHEGGYINFVADQNLPFLAGIKDGDLFGDKWKPGPIFDTVANALGYENRSDLSRAVKEPGSEIAFPGGQSGVFWTQNEVPAAFLSGAETTGGIVNVAYVDYREIDFASDEDLAGINLADVEGRARANGGWIYGNVKYQEMYQYAIRIERTNTGDILYIAVNFDTVENSRKPYGHYSLITEATHFGLETYKNLLQETSGHLTVNTPVNAAELSNQFGPDFEFDFSQLDG